MNKKIILIIVILLLVGIVIFLTYGHERVFSINKVVDINIGGYNQTINAKSMVNVNIDNSKYVKIFMEVENKKDIDTKLSFHQFYLVNNKDQEISLCYHDGMNRSNLDGIITDSLKANSKIEGYLYCPIKDNNYDKLKIKVISGGTIDDDQKINYEYQDYFIELTK